MSDRQIDIGRITVQVQGGAPQGGRAFADALGQALHRALADCPGGHIDRVTIPVAPGQGHDPAALAGRIADAVRRQIT